MTDFVILVTGARKWPIDRAGRTAVYRSLHDAATRIDPDGAERTRGAWPFPGRDERGYWPNITVREGDALGLDRTARAVAPLHGMLVHTMPADWGGPCDIPTWCQPGHRKRRDDGTLYCPLAGHRRNDEMCLCDPIPSECLGYPIADFPNGGTWDCMMRAAEHRIPVRQIMLDGSAKLWDPAELLRGRAILAARRRVRS